MNTLKIVLIAALLLPAIACNRGAKSAIVGSWHEVNGSDSVTFAKDGTFTAMMAYGMSGHPSSMIGTYFVDGQKASITVPNHPDDSMTWEVKIEGDQMTVTYTAGGAVKMDGSMARFRRT